MSNENNIVFSKDDDQQMAEANLQAQATFKYLWRELSWERRRIVPGLDMALVKIKFTDSNVKEGDPDVEHMWVDEIEFDGKHISGILMNSPNWLTNAKEGDHVKAELSALSDWMFSVEGKVFGGFTVNLLRSTMEPPEMKEHDQAWGLDFGDPNEVELVYTKPQKKGGLLSFFSKPKVDPDVVSQAMIEHPMCINMGDSLAAEIKKSDDFVHGVDGDGWTMLHREALAGNATLVKILLEHGADKNLTTKAGLTPLDLANIMDWEVITGLLR